MIDFLIEKRVKIPTMNQEKNIKEKTIFIHKDDYQFFINGISVAFRHKRSFFKGFTVKIVVNNDENLWEMHNISLKGGIIRGISQ